MDDVTRLTEEAKGLIRKYVITLVAIPGAVLSIVAFAMGYMINDIAKQNAYHDAYRDASGRILSISERATRALADAEHQQQEIEQIREQLSIISSEATELQGKIRRTEEIVEAFKNAEHLVVSVKDLLLGDENFLDRIRRSYIGLSGNEKSVSVSGDIEVPMNEWGGDLKKITYGNGVHEWKNKSISCPPGYYVVGIDVIHGGTCHNQCDPDGAVIREIILSCRGL